MKKSKIFIFLVIVCIGLYSMTATADDLICVRYNIAAWSDGAYSIIFETESVFSSVEIDGSEVTYTEESGGKYIISEMFLSEGIHSVEFRTTDAEFLVKTVYAQPMNKITADIHDFVDTNFKTKVNNKELGGYPVEYMSFSTPKSTDMLSEYYVNLSINVPESGNYKFTGILNKHDIQWMSAWKIKLDDAEITSGSSGFKGRLSPYNNDYLCIYDLGAVELEAGEHNITVCAPAERTASTGGFYLKIKEFTFEKINSGTPVQQALKNVRIEGENGVCNQDITNSKGAAVNPFQSTENASGGLALRFVTDNQPIDGGYIFNYTFTIDKAAYYNMYFSGGTPGNIYVSPVSYCIDGDDYSEISNENFMRYKEGTMKNYEVLSGHYVSLAPIYLAEGEHTLALKISDGRASNGEYYCIMDYFEFSELGFTFETESGVIELGETSPVKISSTLPGMAANDYSQAEFECTSDNEYIVSISGENIYALGIGKAKLSAQLVTDTEIYTSEAYVSTSVMGITADEQKSLSDGSIALRFKNHSKSDCNICLVTVIRTNDGKAEKISFDNYKIYSESEICVPADVRDSDKFEIFAVNSENGLNPITVNLVNN